MLKIIKLCSSKMSKGLLIVSAKTLHEVTNGQYPPSCEDGFLVILQQGPTCGLVAILMAFYNSCRHPIPIPIPTNFAAVDADVGFLLSLAKASGDSDRGEIFDPDLMVSLIRRFGGRWRRRVEAFWRPWMQPSDLFLDSPGVMALIAYDKGNDNYPVVRDGSNSHWCLVPYTTSDMVLAFHGLSRLALWTEKSRLFSSNRALAVRRGFWDCNGGFATRQTGLVSASYPIAREGSGPNKLAGSIVFIKMGDEEDDDDDPGDDGAD